MGQAGAHGGRCANDIKAPERSSAFACHSLRSLLIHARAPNFKFLRGRPSLRFFTLKLGRPRCGTTGNAAARRLRLRDRAFRPCDALLSNQAAAPMPDFALHHQPQFRSSAVPREYLDISAQPCRLCMGPWPEAHKSRFHSFCAPPTPAGTGISRNVGGLLIFASVAITIPDFNRDHQHNLCAE